MWRAGESVRAEAAGVFGDEVIEVPGVEAQSPLGVAQSIAVLDDEEAGDRASVRALWRV